MRIVDEAELQRHRGPGPCSWCNKYGQTREAAHIFACGRDSGSRLDIPINIVSLGMGGWVGVGAVCNCHSDSHNKGTPSRNDLLVCMAVRESVCPEDAEAVIWMLMRLPKAPSIRDIEHELRVNLHESARSLAEKTLWEARRHLPETTAAELAEILQRKGDAA